MIQQKQTLVGMTYDLKQDYLNQGYSEEETAEFDSEETIEAIETALIKQGFAVSRIGNVRQLIRELNSGNRYDMVFNICEGLKGMGREAQVPALLEAFDIPYVFSGPMTLSLTLHKALAKRVIRDAGIATPDFAVVYNEQDIPLIDLPFPLFAKPLAEGTGKGIDGKSLINNMKELEQSCIHLLHTFSQPALVEKYLPGREFTAGITGTGKEAEVVGVMEIVLHNPAEKEVYSYTNKAEYEKRVHYVKTDGVLAEQIGQVALASYRVFECLDGGRVDVRMDADGIPNFIEINPLAGLHPVHSDLPILCRMNGISYDRLMERIMRSACIRYNIPHPGIE